jgi:hypothetical protein
MNWAPSRQTEPFFHSTLIETASMPDLLLHRNVPSRPAFANLVAAMAKLSRPRRIEVARFGRKARAAKVPRIRRLARDAAAEARRLAMEAAL